MKHATPETIQSISSFLSKIGELPGLKERKPGIYYRKSKAFLHFHEEGGLIFADVRLSGNDFDRVPCTTKKEQAAFF